MSDSLQQDISHLLSTGEGRWVGDKPSTKGFKIKLSHVETAVLIVTQVFALSRDPRKCLKIVPLCAYQKANQAFKLSVVLFICLHSQSNRVTYLCIYLYSKYLYLFVRVLASDFHIKNQNLGCILDLQ